MSEPLKKAQAKPAQEPLSWLGRLILAPEHGAELEQASAVNEYGLKMPRKEAESAAYADYEKRQRAEAAAHHLAGMKAAHAAGDLEAAQKHGLLYSMHVKALGEEPAGPAPSSVAALLQGAKVYRFRPHKGDHFAVQAHRQAQQGQPVDSAQPQKPVEPVAKRELLYKLWRTLAKAERGGEVHPGRVYAALYRLEGSKLAAQTGEEDLDPFTAEDADVLKAAGLMKGAVVGSIPGVTVKQPAAPQGYDDLNAARAVKWARQSGEATHCLSCKQPAAVTLRGVCRNCVQQKAELAMGAAPTRSPKPRPCRCTAYHHPHRTGGGKCAAPKGR